MSAESLFLKTELWNCAMSSTFRRIAADFLELSARPEYTRSITRAQSLEGAIAFFVKVAAWGAANDAAAL
jgi:hypothetical protein